MVREQFYNFLIPKNRRSPVLTVTRAGLNKHKFRQYLIWCKQQKPDSNTQKPVEYIMQEFAKYKVTEVYKAFTQHRSGRGYLEVVFNLLKDNLGGRELNDTSRKAIYDAFASTSRPKHLFDVLTHLAEHSNILDDACCINAVTNIVNFENGWIVPLQNVRVEGDNPRVQFSSVIRQLFTRYEVPMFMDSVWFEQNPLHMEWYLHLGQGKNIRSAKYVPVKLTRKMAHLFGTAPGNYSVLAAFRWAQVLSLGGDKKIVDAVLETKLGRVFIDNDFWLSVLQFFVNHPEMEFSHYVPIVNFIFDVKYEKNMEGLESNKNCFVCGHLPDFSIKGRTPESMLRLIDHWHAESSKISRMTDEIWKSSNIPGLHYTEKNDKRFWVIRELLSSRELYIEGFIQNHCVATYDEYCIDEKSSIWTMEVYKDKRNRKLLTLEVDNNTKTIIEIRGRNNRLPFENEVSVIKRWAKRVGLKVNYDETDYDD